MTEEEKNNNSENIELENEVGQEENESTEISWETKHNELNDKYLRLYSEFDNFRRRTAKERIDLFKTAAEDVLKDLLPVLDDFDRALTSMDEKSDINTLKEGVDLVHNKFKTTLQNQGLKPMKSIGEKFDPEIHEAITKIPAPKKKLKGKVVDEIEKGYLLNDKVIRYAKVVVGE